jgi:putative ABC transport system ATP-binding protein
LSSVILQTESLSKIYSGGGIGTVALDDVSIKIYEGEFIAIMGPSGSGKSTLLNLIGALDSPTSGKIQVDGIETTTLDSAGLALLRNKKIGFIFQSFNLISRFSALGNVELPLSILGVSANQRKKRAYEMLKMVGLEDRWKNNPNQLSGGQQQRVAIARALSVNPPIILGDEPTGNLYTTTSKSIIDLLYNLNQDTHKTIILITHDPEVAIRASRVITFEDGHIKDEDYDIKLKKTI